MIVGFREKLYVVHLEEAAENRIGTLDQERLGEAGPDQAGPVLSPAVVGNDTSPRAFAWKLSGA
jgi:hypothetical protein